MKRARQEDEEALSAYLGGAFARSARYDEQAGHFTFCNEQGVKCSAGGLLSWIKTAHFPHYVEGLAPSVRSKIKRGKPSNALQGIRVDTDMEAVARGGSTDGLHPMSAALLAHWQAKGHSVVAAQVPARLNAHRMTRADVITRDNKSGKLWTWEVKSGMPAALNQKQGVMQGIPGAPVPCTKANQWALQCEFTRRALVQNAGLPIAGARVIQVWEVGHAGRIEVKEHRNPAWLKQLKLG